MTSNEAAQELGITRQRVGQLIRAGRLKAVKRGSEYHITPFQLEKVRVRKPGPPFKKKAGE